jgi:hypothetical protein
MCVGTSIRPQVDAYLQYFAAVETNLHPMAAHRQRMIANQGML